jgi:hypothetical protein
VVKFVVDVNYVAQNEPKVMSTSPKIVDRQIAEHSRRQTINFLSWKHETLKKDLSHMKLDTAVCTELKVSKSLYYKGDIPTQICITKNCRNVMVNRSHILSKLFKIIIFVRLQKSYFCFLASVYFFEFAILIYARTTYVSFLTIVPK